MRNWVLSVVTLALIALAAPLVASAGGWAGSIYDKSECTYTKETNTLFCETARTTETFTTEQMTSPDATCASGLRLISRTGTRVEVTPVFDFYWGRAPVHTHNLGGNEGLPSEHWENFTDTPLGCV